MATYVNDLRLKEITTGDESGTWGTSTNTNLELIAEAFSFGTEAITTNADTHTTTIADGSTDPGRSLFLKYTGTLDSTCTITIGPNTISKLWLIENATSGSQSIIIKQGSGATVTIANGSTKAIYSDGAGAGGAMVDAFVDLDLTGTTTVAGLTASGASTLSGGATISGTTAVATLTASGNATISGNASVTGNVTAANLNADATAGVYGSSSSPVVFTVTVASKTSAHPYNGDGSSSGYFFDGIESPAISLHGTDSVTANSEYVYRFDQADGSNSGHPLLFYMDAAKTTAYTTGVTTNGTPGSAGAYTQIAVDRETPSVLYYQCSSHAYMGNYAYNAASTNLNGIKMPTADGSSGQVLSTNGSGVLSFATVGGAYNSWLVKTSAYTAVAGDQIIVNSASAVTITLPASASAGNTVIIKATGGGTVTIGRNSQKINSTAADGTILSGSASQLVFVDATIGFLEI